MRSTCATSRPCARSATRGGARCGTRHRHPFRSRAKATRICLAAALAVPAASTIERTCHDQGPEPEEDRKEETREDDEGEARREEGKEGRQALNPGHVPRQSPAGPGRCDSNARSTCGSSAAV